MNMTYPSDLTDAEWACVQRYFPPLPQRGRPRTHPLRRILDAIFYVSRTGCPWRYLPVNFPPWQMVFYHVRRWRRQGVWSRLYRDPHAAERERVGRDAQPSADIMDAQSVKTVEKSAKSAATTATNASKDQVASAGRYAWLPIAVYVTPADLSDSAGAHKLLAELAPLVPRLKKMWADAAYRGKELADWCKRYGGRDSRSSSASPAREASKCNHADGSSNVVSPGCHAIAAWPRITSARSKPVRRESNWP